MNTNVQKRFPSDSAIEPRRLTFLLDKNVDSELYAYLQLKSHVAKDIEPDFSRGGTIPSRVMKSDLDSQAAICRGLGKISRSTLKRHFDYLLEKGYLVEEEGGKSYLLPLVEDHYVLVPVDTIKFLLHNVRSDVFKTYTYLLSMWKWCGSDFTFSATVIAEHLGLNPTWTPNLDKVRDHLILLKDIGLIDYCTVYQEIKGSGNGGLMTQKLRLMDVRTECQHR